MRLGPLIALILFFPVVGMLVGLGIGKLFGGARKPFVILGLIGGATFALWLLMRQM